jgi:hypothetical protein
VPVVQELWIRLLKIVLDVHEIVVDLPGEVDIIDSDVTVPRVHWLTLTIICDKISVGGSGSRCPSGTTPISIEWLFNQKRHLILRNKAGDFPSVDVPAAVTDLRNQGRGCIGAVTPVCVLDSAPGEDHARSSLILLLDHSISPTAWTSD